MNVRVVCDDCGEVSIPIKELHVRFCLDTSETTLWFMCPACNRRAFSVVHPSKRAMLLSHPAIQPECWMLPEEIFENHSGPPIGWDDIVDLHHALAAL